MEIEKAIVRFCAGKNIPATKERVQMQADYLRSSGYDESEIVKAIDSLFGETQFFPDASLVLKKLKPSNPEYETEAELITSKILEANKKFGAHDIQGLKEFVGTKGYRVIERFGGWDCIMRLTYDELNTARAQIKRIALSQTRIENDNPKLEYSKNERANELKKLNFEGAL